MSDHSKNAIQALVMALEMVAPSVDPNDPIATEQLQSAVRYLQFLQSRLDHLYDRERFELRHHLTMGDRLLASAGAGDWDTTALAAAASTGHAVLNQLGANVPEMRECTVALSAAIANVVESASTTSDVVRDEVVRVVLDCSAERITFERSWYLPLGFDHAPDEVLPLDVALAKVRSQDMSGTAAGAGSP